MQLKIMEPQSRVVMRALFKRSFDGFTESAQRTTNWAMLIGDIVLVYIVLNLL